MSIFEEYPVLKRHMNLRISKGRKICRNLRTGDCELPDEGSFAFLSMCSGSHRLKDIFTAHTQVYGREVFPVDDILKKYGHLLDFSSLPARARQLEHMAEMLKARRSRWPYHPFREETPFRLEASLTEVCNHRCSYCYQGSEHKDEHGLHLEEWKDVMKQAAELGVQEIVFTGGEPTLYRGFLELVKTAVSHGLYPRISTNGSTLDPAMTGALHEAGAEYIHLSLPAVTSALYGRITGAEKSLDQVKRAIPLLKRSGFYIRVKMVLTPENTMEAGRLLEYCGENGVDLVHLAPFIASTRTGKDYALVPDEDSLVRVMKTAEAAEKRYPDLVIAKPALGLWEWRNEKEIVRCGGVKESLTVIHNGNITFCESLGGIDGFVMGNVRSQTLEEIWNSPIPDRYTVTQAKSEPCKSCEYLEKCGTGCFLFSYMAQKDAFSADPRCFRYNGHRIGAAGEEKCE
ncbi:radical SAM protein [Lachnospiraceae bacterium 54-53]